MAELAVVLAVSDEVFGDSDIACGAITFVVMALSLAIGHRAEKRKIKQYVEQTVPGYTFQQFKTFFRVTPDTFQILLGEIAAMPSLAPRVPVAGRPHIQLEKMLLMTLWYMATLDSIREIADRFDVSESTFIKWQIRIICVLCELSHVVIKWPTQQGAQEIMNSFHAINGFPGVLGAIDGTHIRIEAPIDDANAYYNRKGYHSVVLQAVCQADRRFTNIYCGWPGKVHDARIFRNSPLCDSLPDLCGPHHILGDGGAYPLRTQLMTPYRDNGHLTREQKNFNKKLSQLRVVIEQAFGIVKGRFRRLQYVMIRDAENIVRVITAACALHNICVMNNDDFQDCFDEPEVRNIIPIVANQANVAAFTHAQIY